MRSIFIALAGVLGTAPVFAAQDRLVPAEAIPYALEAPDQPQQLGKLWGERATGPAGTLLKVPGHWVAPVHAHTADYRAVVIEGVWKHWRAGSAMADAAELRPGSYWTQIADEPHEDACVSASGCVILLVNDDPYRTYLPKRWP